jgi:hypothetical protein
MCTGRCRNPPYTCSGASEPEFLTAEQRHEYDLAYLRGQTNFRYPFELYVVRSWAQHLDFIGGFEISDEIRTNILASVAIANDPTLTHQQKMRKLRCRSVAGKPGRKKGRD